MEYPHVSIIIINWKYWEDTIKCLESVYENKYTNYDVIVVNNGSEASFKKLIENINGMEFELSILLYSNKNFTLKFIDHKNNLNYQIESKNNEQTFKRLFLIKNDKNYGFAEGNNIGLEYATKNLKSDYILLLNNDTLVDNNFLNELIKVAESDRRIGSVQSMLLKIDKITIDSLGQQMLTWGAKDVVDKIGKPLNGEIEIFGACAASALYRGDLIKKIGLFDTDFFILLEDVDLSWRIRLLGMTSILAINSVVYHQRGVSKTNSFKNILYISIHSKSNDQLLKWYHESKNWLIIFIRYYPLRMIFISLSKCPRKVFLTFLIFIYSSIKLRKTNEGINLLLNNYKIRKNNKRNQLLQKVQKNWIK